jgi:hypothetical protein
MMWDLPIAVDINGKSHPIRNKCDYRVVLDAICALNDDDLTNEEKAKCALFIFYEDISQIDDFETAIKEMFRIINGGEQQEENQEQKPQLMDWEHDFPQIAPPISRVLGYDVRTPNRYCHFWTFLGAYMEIGECTFSTIVSIRSKRAKGKKLDKWEEEYIREHRKMVELPRKLTAEEEEFLNSDW